MVLSDTVGEWIVIISILAVTLVFLKCIIYDIIYIRYIYPWKPYVKFRWKTFLKFHGNDKYPYDFDYTNITMLVSFDTFQNWYNLNPDRYRLFGNTIGVCIDTENGDKIEKDIVYVGFNTYNDLEKYYDFKRNIEEYRVRNNLNRKSVKNQKRILQAIQEDAENMHKRAEEEIQQALDITKKVQENINEIELRL